MIWRLTCNENPRGLRSRCMPDSSGVRLPFLWLQRLHDATRLSHADSPPRERGCTWSSVSSEGGYCFPQYWQVEWSRSRMFLRESERRSKGMWMYSVSRITEGAWIASFCEWSMCPLCSSTRATPLKIITTARLSVHTLTGSKEVLRTKTLPFILWLILRERGRECQKDVRSTGVIIGGGPSWPPTICA